MYMLDTDICVYAIKLQAGVLNEILAVGREHICVSVISEAELRTGSAKSAAPLKSLRFLENFLRPLPIIEFTSSDARVYAHLRARLERAGTPIGALDLLIAAHALSRDLTLVTNNEREFRRVGGLRVENWATSPS